MELLDPRHDLEPPYWEALRRHAGLRADWSYDLLRVAAWCAPGPLLLSVFRDHGEVLAVVCASWSGPGRARSYVHARPALGLLHVQSPGTSAVPGWWFADRLGPTQRADLCRDYVRAMRRELGPRCRGVVWRHAAVEDLPVLRTGRRTLLRSTDAVAMMPVSGVDQWLAGLRPSRRRDLSRQHRQVEADPDLVVTVDGCLEPAALARLLRHTDDKYTDRHTGLPVATAYLAGLLAREDVWTVAYADHTGRPLAFMTTLDHPVCPVARLWGAVPGDAGGRRHLYFDAYVRTNDWAARAGRKEVNYGRGKLPLKRDLGCELHPRYSVAVPCR